MGYQSEKFADVVQNERYNSGDDILLKAITRTIKEDMINSDLDPNSAIPSLRTIYLRLQALEIENANLKQELADIAGLDIIKTVGKLAKDGKHK